ncbi:TolB family protein, partial [candidate division KSB1 bacterium]
MRSAVRKQTGPWRGTGFVPFIVLIPLVLISGIGCDRTPTEPEQLVKSLYLARGFACGDVGEDGNTIVAVTAPRQWDIYWEGYGRPVLFTPDGIQDYPQVLLAWGDWIGNAEAYEARYFTYLSSISSLQLTNPVIIRGTDSAQMAYVQIEDWNFSIRLSSVVQSYQKLVYSSSAPIDCLSSTADGNWLVFTKSLTNPAGIYRVKLDGSAEPEFIGNDTGWGPVSAARCSPVENTIIFAMEADGQQNVYRIAVSGGKCEKLTDFRDPNVRIAGVAESYDRRRLALGMNHVGNNKPNSLYIFDLQTGENKEVLTTRPDPPLHIWADENLGASQTAYPSWDRPCWFPDGNRLLIDCYNRFKLEYILEQREAKRD